jgi:Transglutaminase-like superfamily
MWERLRRFSLLDAEARGIFLHAAVLLPLISVSLRIRGFQSTQRLLLRSLPRVRHTIQTSQQSSNRIVNDSGRTQLTSRMVNAVVRHAWRGSTCLQKSLALWWLLGRQEIASELRIGARKLDGKFQAHAWVERNGVAVNEPQQEHRHYATFDAAFPLQSSEPS